MSSGLLVLFATVSWGIWAFALRKAMGHMPPLAVHVAYSLATVLLVPVYLALARRQAVPLRFPVSGIVWAALAASLVGAGVVAMMYAMRARDASQIVALTASYPAVTLLLAVLFLGESLTASRVCGVLTIAAGAYLVSR
jgi:bacterial/archaeal transporter family protein